MPAVPDRNWIREKLQESAQERREWPAWLKTTRNLDENGIPRRPSSPLGANLSTDSSSHEMPAGI